MTCAVFALIWTLLLWPEASHIFTNTSSSLETDIFFPKSFNNNDLDIFNIKVPILTLSDIELKSMICKV